MDLVQVARAITEIDVADATRGDVHQLLRHITTLRRLADGIELAGNRRLLALAAVDPAISPEHVNAEATQRRLQRAHQAVKSAKAAEGCPFFADALARGEISLGHLEVFARGLRSLNTMLRPRLSAIEPSLVRIAARLCVEDFADRVRVEVRDIEGDDGKGRLEQQRQRARARSWTDSDGMWNLHAAFDPETGMILDEILRKVTERLFRDGISMSDAPEDPQMKQEWLRAQALRMIMTGEVSVGRGETTIVVVTDEHTFRTGRRHAATRFDVNGVDTLPVELLAKYSQRARFVAALVDSDGKLVTLGRKVRTADELVESFRNPVSLNLGRTRRTANGDQHLAKRVMYRTCAIPGCRVPAHRCELHHIHEWEHGGTTDIENLVPICPYHHDRIHADGWTLQLGPDRSLTVRKHGVILMSTGPPGQQWTQAA
jgi:hypothetical protein